MLGCLLCYRHGYLIFEWKHGSKTCHIIKFKLGSQKIFVFLHDWDGLCTLFKLIFMGSCQIMQINVWRNQKNCDNYLPYMYHIGFGILRNIFHLERRKWPSKITFINHLVAGYDSICCIFLVCLKFYPIWPSTFL